MNYHYLLTLLEKQKKFVALAHNTQEVKRIVDSGRAAVMLSIESGAALAGDISNVEYFARCGVQMMTLTWNGKNELASGNDTDEGFSDFGREVVAKMEEVGIIVDASHLNEQSFWELTEIAKKPFICTHSDLRSVCYHLRNLTEDEFSHMVKIKGLVGINLDKNFLGNHGTSARQRVADHILRMLELGGEDVLACGSDFDGGELPEDVNNPVKFASVSELLLEQGVSQQIVDKIFYENAMKFFNK